jgi:lipopolysaccharide/colanic/teichoic acid biosynthesis glycosyltransferase
VGLAGKPFNLLKFRSMRPEQNRISEWEGDNLHRITRVGKWLRKYRLDELPQLFNVLLGDMNVVGPRPHPSANSEVIALVSRNTPVCGSQIPFYSLRSLVRPGITGWAQVRYQYANNLNEEIEKMRFDLYYIKHYSLWLDLRILFETIRVVLVGNKVVGSNGKSESSQPV